MKKIILAFFALSVVVSSCCTTPKESYIAGTGINTQFIDSSMMSAIAKGFFPGAQVVIGNRDSILFSKTYGYHDYSKADTVKAEDVYDMASCSKVLGTTLATMRLVGEGKIALEAQLGEVLPKYAKSPLADLTLFEMLTHTTGMVPFIPFYKQLVSTTDGQPLLSKDSSENYPARFGDVFVYKSVKYDSKYIAQEPKEGYVLMCDNLYLNPAFYEVMDAQIVKGQTGTRGTYAYSDLNLILAQRMLEEVSGVSLDKFLAGIYAEMGLKNIGYKPLDWTALSNTIPTETDNIFRMRTVQGYAHDEVAAILGNVAGHAGLFSNAHDAAVVSQMFLNKGQWNGKQILKSEVVEQFTATPLLEKGVYRGIGFDKRKPGNGVFGENSFGHTGFTGTFFWIDADKGLYLVMLTNRVHPTRENGLMYDDDFRPKFWTYMMDHAEAPTVAAQ